MEFRILGPFEVRDGDRILELPRQKHRALLATLLLRVGEVVSADRLVEDLWGEEPPPSARASLQNVVSQLRRTLGADVLVTRPSGYVLDIDPALLDLEQFNRLVDAARLATGEERAAKLRRGLGLWRGPPLADLAFEPFAGREVDKLQELETSAREELVDAELALGLHAELVPRIEELVARNPLRERLRGQLMLALYRSGRQAEALEAYQETRRALVEELGIEPSPGLRELEQAILRQDPDLAPDAVGGRPGRPESRALRKRATVLFAELAVAGGAELDPETLHRTATRALEEIRAATEYHGGSVGRAAGDELMAVFGAPAAHEDDPLRAVRAALQMRRALAAMNEARIDVRTAIATGELIVGAGLGSPQASGHAVTFARRLAETALPGEILLDADTAKLGGAAVAAEEAEPRAVRGEPRPVAAFRLTGLRRGPSSPPVADAAMVGRDRELARLRELFDEACAERECRVVTVLGEPGIGKTRLVSELVASVADRATVLTGHCVSYGEGATYLPVGEVIAQASAGEDPRASIAGRLAGGPDAELVAERIAELLGHTGGPSSTGEAFWAVRSFLEGLAAERPLVVVFEDVHWAEATFLDLVEYLEQWSTGAPLLVVCLARPDLLEERPRWGARSIELGPLPEADALELVARVAGGEVPPEARDRIVEVAEGNPLFAEQMVAHAAEEGAEALAAIPPSIEALLSSRLDRLPDGERAVLERAAVVGREFWHGAVLHLAGPLEVPSVGRHLLELVRKGLIRPGRPLFPREDAFRFHHVLIRDVAYASMPGGLRAELHEHVADWLESQAPEQDELIAYHLEQAYLCRVGAGPPDRQARRLAADAGDRLAAAGLRAAKRGDVAAASNLLGRATALLPPAEALRRDLLAELGVVLWRAGDVERTEEVLRESLAAALAAGNRRAELRSRLELANLRLYREPEGGAEDLLTLAASAIPLLEELGDHRALGRAWFATASVHGAIHCRYRASEQAAAEALDSFRRSGWPPSACLQALAAALFLGPTPVEEGVRSCLTLLEGADLGSEANVLVFLAGLEAMRGSFDEARSLAGRSRALYEQLGWTDRIVTNWAPITGGIELLAGDPEAAAAVLEESCAELAARHELAHLATQAAQLGEALYRLERYEEAARWAGVSAEGAASDDASAQFSWRALRAKLMAREGAVEDAERLAREGARLAAATDALSQRGDVILDLAEVLRLAGRADEAAGEVERALALFELKGHTVSSGRAVRLLAELTPA